MTATIVVTTIALSLPILLILWQMTSQTVLARLPSLRNKRICLLIAHPDDEAMFFGPTLQALTAGELGNHVKVLCLSSGDADGLGETRKKELLESVLTLGLRSPSDAFILDDPARFPDSMSKTWAAADIADVLISAFAPPLPQPKSPVATSTPKSTGKGRSKNKDERPAAVARPVDDGPPRCTIDVLITFDGGGVSSHPNHVSLFHGARAFLARLMKGKSGYAAPLDVYTLQSTNIVRKYMSVFDAPFSLAMGAVRSSGLGVLGDSSKGAAGRGAGGPGQLLFVNGMVDWIKGVKAMTQGHKSQMVWFRWGWVGLGRYMIVNDLKREKTPVM